MDFPKREILSFPGIDSLFTGFSEIDDDFYEELEELLVMGDIGINTTMSIIDGLKERVKKKKLKKLLPANSF